MRRYAATALLSFGFLACLATVATAQPKSSDSAAKDGGSSAPVAAAKDGGASSSTPVATSKDGGAAAPAGSGPAVPIPEKPQMDGATYSVRLRDLEQRVDELKDQIRRSHTRLALLSDTIISGGAAGSRAEVVFKNEMSSAFRLTRALFVVDGAVQYNRQDDSGALADQKEIPIFNGSMPPGDHTVQVILNFQGNGYGVFTYLRGYKFEVKSAHSFTAVEGKTLGLVATALEKGGVTTPLEQRPTIEWGERVASLGPGGSGANAPPAPAVKTQGSSSPGSASGSVQIGGGK
ncbi:MAG: hypothetical protein U0270_10750 [Labilithrix sp.]